MKHFIKVFLLISLLINQSFAINSQFKAAFMKEENKPEKETVFLGKNQKTSLESEKEYLDFSIEEQDAIFSPINFSDESTLRVLEPKKNCLIDSNGNENCPESAVQCNELIEKSDGFSTLHKKTIVVNKYLDKKTNMFTCPKDFYAADMNNSKDGLCKKDYSYYTYSCNTSDKNEYNIGWKGPIELTGEDCFGKCGPNGCICNSKKPPKNNCFRENYGCPFDIEQKCTQMKDSKDTRTKPFKGVIFELGESKKIEKTLISNKICSKGFSLINNKCLKEEVNSCQEGFTIINNTCEKEIKCDFKVNSNNECYTKSKNETCPTGFNLENGNCIQPNLTINKLKVKENKIIEFYDSKKTCPINSTFNKELNKCEEIGSCIPGYYLEGDICKKEYSYFEYSCPENYTQKIKGEDCQGICGPNGCQCNSETPPQNNCYIPYDIDNPDIEYSYKRLTEIIKPEGFFKKEEYGGNYGFSDIENEREAIFKIFAKKEGSNELCFKNRASEESCIKVPGCNFEGSISEHKIKEIFINDKFIETLGSTDKITSTCSLNGHVGWKDRIEGITSVISENNKILFWDSFIDNYLGFIEFIQPINEKNTKEGFELENTIAYELLKSEYKTSDYLNGYTYFVSNIVKPINLCQKDAKKYNLELEYKFESPELRDFLKLLSGDRYSFLSEDKNSISKCILKTTGNKTFSSNKYYYKKEKKTEGYSIFKCSPISCEENQCQKASCQEGYNGLIHTAAEFVEEGECQLQSCDANKPYSPYCGVSKECDITNPNILMRNGECTKVTCSEGTFDKEKNKCIIKKCDEGFHLEDNKCLKD